jgi:aspartate aminotransferase
MVKLKLSRRSEVVQPSPTLAIGAQAKAMKAKGIDVVSLASGEPDFDTPDYIKDAAIAALRAGFTKYTATAGIPELRDAVARKLTKDNDFRVAAEHVLVSNGAKHSLYNLFQALLDEGDEVVIFSPYWVSYPELVGLAGGKAVIVETRVHDGYVPDPDALRRALTPRTQAVVINSPCNPTGAVLSRENLAAIAGVLRNHQCLIVSDDIYEPLVYEGRTFCNIANAAPDLAPRTVIVNGCSKTYAMTGWRIGYAAGPATLIAAMTRIQDQSTSNVSSITQKAALAALTGPQDSIERMRTEYDRRRHRIVELLNSIDGISCPIPAGAFYAFPDISALLRKSHGGEPIRTSIKLAELLLNQARVATIPGAPFGAEGFLRLSFVNSMEQIEKGAVRIEEFVKTLH